MPDPVTTALPTSIQAIEHARPGPTVDGTAVLPGDILHEDSGQQRVVLGTGFGQHNSGLRLFDPDACEQVQPQGNWTTLSGSAWSLPFQALGCATELDSEKRTQHLLVVGYDPTRQQYRCLYGSSPVGGTHAPISADTVLGRSEAEVDDALAPPFPGGSTLASVARVTPELPETVRAQVKTLAGRRLTATSGRTDGATHQPTNFEIPTGTGEAVWSEKAEPTLIPGDRLVVWPDTADTPGSPVGIEGPTLDDSRCVALLHSEGDAVRWFDFERGRTEIVTKAAVGRRVRLAHSRGFVLQLLARDSFVDPIGTPRTYSIHCYRVLGGDGPAWVLAAGRTETATPRLEHPLTLPGVRFESQEALATALATPETLSHPLQTWAAATAKVRKLCHRVANYVRQAADRPSLNYQGL
jgi:hypothetical protein